MASNDDPKAKENVPEAKENGEGAENKPETVVIDDEEDDDEVIDEEQLEEYQEMVDQLGNFPDKVKINSLSMVAEDHSDSRKSSLALYECIRKPLISASVSRDRKLPLVYVLDSILKNVKGEFIGIIEEDAKIWMPLVHEVLPGEQRQKLKRVWNMWREFKIFNEKSWTEMGKCFSAPAPKTVAGLTRAADGTLQIPTRLRKEMQAVLDDLQSNVENELEKVSLERLADIDPDLLRNIKKTAEDVLSSGQSGSTQNQSQGTSMVVMETRSPDWIARCNEWNNLKLDRLEQSHDLIANLQHYVRDSPETMYTQTDALQMTSVLAAASATASLLTNALQRLKDQDDNKENENATSMVRHFATIDKSLFTNDGVKKKDITAIGSLYEAGLPFLSSTDGKRFATQSELSSHMDYLFKKNQLEKSMERTEERGWYVETEVWIKQSSDARAVAAAPSAPGREPTFETAAQVSAEDADPSTFTMPADESRDRCAICGINFKMVYNNEEGIFTYSNCREIQVTNDDVAERESEPMLVHVTCWRGLGSPEVLTMDQALQEARH